MLTLDSSDDNKGVSSEGPSITSIPKEGPSIARRSKKPIPKELLEWYEYETVKDYLPVAKKPIPKVIFKRPIPIKGYVQTSQKGKERFDVEGYESEKYSDDEDADGTNHAEDADGTNHSDLKLVKRGITKLYKFHREYSKPGGIKIKQYFDVDLTVTKLVMRHLGLREKYILPNLNTPSKLNELPAKYSAIVKAEEWVEFVNYTTIDAYKEKSVRGKMTRSKNVYHYKMGQEIRADEEPPRGIMWLKGRVNKDGEFTVDEIRSVGDKVENGGYARGVGSGVTYKRYFYLPQNRQATDERIELLQTQLDNERRERQQKDEPVKTVGPKKTPKPQKNGSQNSQSQGNVSPTQELSTNYLVEIQANDHDLLVNSDNENDDMLGYESEKYSDDEDADGTNHSDLKLVKKGIARLYKFRKALFLSYLGDLVHEHIGYESEKYFNDEDANGTNHSDLKLVKRGIARLYKFRKALFLSYLGDLVHEHIGLKILSWKKVDKESRDKLWDEITDLPRLLLLRVISKSNKNYLVEIQANDHDLLVNSDNENDDMLGYESEKYSDDEDADGTNHSDLKLVKKGIARLYKFRK
nr:hypothetical protein [Tanacetum cinerariifolium]